jgi:hypothetical protein
LGVIISHEHKYLFVELPHTASTAISQELRTHYGGSQLLHKHATYAHFLRVASDSERAYFVFSGMRHPMDVAVTVYLRLHSASHRGQPAKGTGRTRLARRWISSRQRFLTWSARSDFASHFLRSYWLPYCDWSSLAHNSFDFVIRYESLQEDFARVLSLLGLEQRRPLPLANPTPGKERAYEAYYTPEIHARACWVFGPHMVDWGYDPPAGLGCAAVSRLSQLAYRARIGVRRLYWRYLL